MISTVVFDGDDTLWWTQVLYDEAKLKMDSLLRNYGIPVKDSNSLIDRIDEDLVKSRGFAMSRFPESLVLAVQAASTLNGVTVPYQAKIKARAIGRAVFDRKTAVAPRARSTLRELGRHFRLVLVTRGDRRIQLRRLRDSGLEQYFDSIYVVDNKTDQTLQAIYLKEGAKPASVTVVGDSLKSDIVPALKSGASAIWLPRDTWRYEESRVPRSSRLVRADSLDDLRVIAKDLKQCLS